MPWPRKRAARLSRDHFQQRVAALGIRDQLGFRVKRHAVVKDRTLQSDRPKLALGDGENVACGVCRCATASASARAAVQWRCGSATPPAGLPCLRAACHRDRSAPSPPARRLPLSEPMPGVMKTVLFLVDTRSRDQTRRSFPAWQKSACRWRVGSRKSCFRCHFVVLLCVASSSFLTSSTNCSCSKSLRRHVFFDLQRNFDVVF